MHSLSSLSIAEFIRILVFSIERTLKSLLLKLSFPYSRFLLRTRMIRSKTRIPIVIYLIVLVIARRIIVKSVSNFYSGFFSENNCKILIDSFVRVVVVRLFSTAYYSRLQIEVYRSGSFRATLQRAEYNAVCFWMYSNGTSFYQIVQMCNGHFTRLQSAVQGYPAPQRFFFSRL